MNWLTSLRPAPWHLYFASELGIPFVPQLIWAYLSMYALFILPLFFIPAERMPPLGKQLIAGSLLSAALFLLLPAEVGFARQMPARAPYAAMSARVFTLARPYN